MAHPIVHEQRNARIGFQIAGFLAGRGCGHDDYRAGGEVEVRRARARGQVGVVHQADVRYGLVTCRQVKLPGLSLDSCECRASQRRVVKCVKRN